MYVNGIWLFGRIVWRKEKAFGIKFEEEMSDYTPAELREVVEQASTHSGEFDREAVLSELVNKQSSGDERSMNENASQNRIYAEAGFSTS